MTKYEAHPEILDIGKIQFYDDSTKNADGSITSVLYIDNDGPNEYVVPYHEAVELRDFLQKHIDASLKKYRIDIGMDMNTCKKEVER